MKQAKAFFLAAILSGCMAQEPIQIAESGYVKVEEGELFYEKFGTGEPMVVLHGGPGFDHSYLMPGMLDLAKDHEVIFYDQRGSGLSLKTSLQPDRINLKHFVKDLDDLRKHFGLKKFILVGHSWGGYLAMSYAIEHPEAVSKLVLITPAPADYKGMQSFLSNVSKKTEKMDMAALSDYEKFKELTAEQVSDLYREFLSVYFYNPKDAEKLTLNAKKESLESGFKVEEELSKTVTCNPTNNLFPKLRSLKVPTLVIHGDVDVIPWQTAKQTHEAIPGAKWVLLKNCGHFPYVEKPSELFKNIREFLKGDN